MGVVPGAALDEEGDPPPGAEETEEIMLDEADDGAVPWRHCE